MNKPITIASSWQQLLLLITILSIMVPSSSSFQSSINTNNQKSSALAYAASSTPGPMSQVDPNARSGGCPFLVTSLDAQRTYAVPALFHPTDEQRPIVLFDGSCTLCNNFVQFLLKYDKAGNLRFAALQSKVGELLLRRMSEEVRNEVLHVIVDDDNDESKKEEQEQYKSLVLCTPDSTYIQSSAVLKILGSLSSSSAKRIKLLQYVGLAGYVLPTRIRDRVYKFVSKRRKSWFGSADECMLYDERFDDRFVDDGVLTGVFRDPFADPNAAAQTTNDANDVLNLFEGESPPQRGDQVQIIWPQNSNLDPSVTYDDEFPNGLCLVGGRGKITNVDLPMRVVMRVDRKSIGLEKDDMGEETMIAWVNPSEVALV
eukprot:scaffold26963_cov155-Skeletonema_dohrnii-CCMP3373.AAC.5